MQYSIIIVGFIFWLASCKSTQELNLSYSESQSPNQKENQEVLSSLEPNPMLDILSIKKPPQLKKILQIPTDHYPKQVCFHPTRFEIYITNLGNHETQPYSNGSLQIFHSKTGELLHKEEAKAAVECLVDPNNPNYLYYTDMFRDELVKFDVTKRKIHWRAKIKESSIKNFNNSEYRFMPKIVYKDKELNLLFVSLWLDGVSILDDNGNLIKRIPKFCSLPRGLLVHENILYVMCYGLGGGGVGEIVQISLPDGEVIDRLETGGSPRHIVPYKVDFALISNLNSKEIYYYSLKEKKILRKIKVGTANTIALDSEEKNLYISDRSGNALVILNVDSWEILGRVPVGKFPTGLAIHPNGKFIAITNFHDNNVDIFTIDKEK